MQSLTLVVSQNTIRLNDLLGALAAVNEISQFRLSIYDLPLITQDRIL